MLASNLVSQWPLILCFDLLRGTSRGIESCWQRTLWTLLRHRRSYRHLPLAWLSFLAPKEVTDFASAQSHLHLLCFLGYFASNFELNCVDERHRLQTTHDFLCGLALWFSHFAFARWLRVLTRCWTPVTPPRFLARFLGFIDLSLEQLWLQQELSERRASSEGPCAAVTCSSTRISIIEAMGETHADQKPLALICGSQLLLMI